MADGHDRPSRRKVLGRAPRARAKSPDTHTAPSKPVPPEPDRPGDAQQLVDDLVRSFREQVRRALQVELDMSATSLAFVDHYLRLAQADDRDAITTLIAAGAGAYYGELVRQDIGGTWIGDGDDPRRLRLLVSAQFIYFAPVDQALQAIVASAGEDAIARVSPIDDAFHLRPGGEADDTDTPEGASESDASWLEARLAELAPVPEREFYTLTCRFETLQLMLELLAAKHAADGRVPREYGVADYLDVLRDASSRVP
jgi:hypothetical protein